MKILDHGYLNLVESWGSDESIIEAARMSTNKGFNGWGTKEKPGDEKLLRYLYEHKHSTPFEMAGMTIEVQAPIFVFREWHRHRTQCLGPDTLVYFDAPKSKKNRRFVYKMRIEDLWKKWQPTQRNKRPERQINALWPRSRIQQMQIRCLNEETGEIIHSNITDVILGTPKPMVTITTQSGRTLTATREHKVFTSLGWKTLGEAIDQKLAITTQSTFRLKNTHKIPELDIDNETWKPVFGWENLYEVSNQGRVRRSDKLRKLVVAKTGYLVVCLNRPGEQSLRTVHSLVLEAFAGQRPAAGVEARHLNHNRQDARLVNLAWGTSKENSMDMLQADRQQRLVSLLENIESVEDAGVLPSYDIAVRGPWHNFIADGVVVHNSYNEMSARYTPLPDLNYVPTVERLLINSKTNKQAGVIKGAQELTEVEAEDFRTNLHKSYADSEKLYQWALQMGVPKELARVHLPVGRYSRMRASANLRNWLAFLTLRMDKAAQWEIREYANAVATLVQERFPKTYELFEENLLI